MYPESDEAPRGPEPLTDDEMRKAIDKRFNEVPASALLFTCGIDCVLCRMLFTTPLSMSHLPHLIAVTGEMSFSTLTEIGQSLI